MAAHLCLSETLNKRMPAKLSVPLPLHPAVARPPSPHPAVNPRGRLNMSVCFYVHPYTYRCLENQSIFVCSSVSSVLVSISFIQKSKRGGLLLYLPSDFRWGISHNEQVLQKYNQTVVSLFSGLFKSIPERAGEQDTCKVPQRPATLQRSLVVLEASVAGWT